MKLPTINRFILFLLFYGLCLNPSLALGMGAKKRQSNEYKNNQQNEGILKSLWRGVFEDPEKKKQRRYGEQLYKVDMYLNRVILEKNPEEYKALCNAMCDGYERGASAGTRKAYCYNRYGEPSQISRNTFGSANSNIRHPCEGSFLSPGDPMTGNYPWGMNNFDQARNLYDNWGQVGFNRAYDYVRGKPDATWSEVAWRLDVSSCMCRNAP